MRVYKIGKQWLIILEQTCEDTRVKNTCLKGGDPAAGSPTATLLRLHPSHESQSGERPPKLDYPLLLQPTPMV